MVKKGKTLNDDMTKVKIEEDEEESEEEEEVTGETQKLDVLKKKQNESITYLGNLLISCVERGGFSIKDVVKINETITNFNSPDSSEEKKKEYLSVIFNSIRFAQSNGKLSIEEAYNCHICISTFISPNNTNVKTI